MRSIRRSLLTLLVAVLASPAAAIVVRHDRDDARYREMAERFPQAVAIRPDGAGVIVGDRWVLTAAHVARGISRREARVVVGDREIPVKRFHLHPEWTSMPHDVALLELAEPVGDVTPVKLYRSQDEVGQTVTFVGCGDTGDGRSGPVKADGIKRAATNVVERADDDWIYFTFDEGDAATDLEGVSGPGDSGGPALVVRDGDVFTLGVSVFADGKGKGPGRYGVLEGYTRVSTHAAWIDSVIGGGASPR